MADFWFDPSCPYTWITSRWLLEAAKVRPLSVNWRVMSLAVLNEGKEVNPEDPEGHYAPEELARYLWSPVRLGAAVRRHHGSDALGRLLTALGRGTHEPQDPEQPWIAPESALAQAGLPTGLAGAAEDTAYDAEVRASHAEAVRLCGPDLGTPVIGLRAPDGRRHGFFGPVISAVPRGEAAGRLWDGLRLVAGVPGFGALVRPPLAAPDFGQRGR